MIGQIGQTSAARARRQDRVAKLVWGTLFLVMGVLFTLHDMGRIDLGEIKGELAAEHAVDGNSKTRWSSAFRDGQWLTIDLGVTSTLSRIRIDWEGAYAKEYDVDASTDGRTWTTVRRVTDGHGGTEEHEVDAAARYVRLTGLRRATPYGVSVWEISVFDSAGSLISQGKRTTASSMEGDAGVFTLWLKFWPLLLLAAGLPGLLAPRDDTNQVVGAALTAVGALLQLQRLGLLSWGLRETASVSLIVVGALILVQAQRRGEWPGEGGAGDAQ